MEPLVSVLTPVYNGEKYLAECIESVLSQNYRNWEYTVVNNCSTDRTREIAEAYARRDPRIRVHCNTEFLGLVQNHNAALSLASPDSKYCKFVHADDLLLPDCLRLMVDLAEQNPSVGIVGAYGIAGSQIVWDGLEYPNSVFPGREICRRTLLGGFYVFGSPTSHLFRTEVVRRRREFYSTKEYHRPYADNEACFAALQECDFGFVHQVLTYSRVHGESATAQNTRSRIANMDFPSKLHVFCRYGPVYLQEEEYQARFNLLEKQYYRYLLPGLFRPRAFWDYHKAALADLGHPFRRAKLVRVALFDYLPKIASPLWWMPRLFGRTARTSAS